LILRRSRPRFGAFAGLVEERQMAAKAGARAVDGKLEGEKATAKKAGSKARRESPPDTYLNSMNGKRRPKHGKKGKLAKGY
jgi:hypothetical protein